MAGVDPRPDGVAAFARQRSALLDYCADLTDAQWYADSAAAGWRVHDVVAHLAASCRVLFSPAAVTVMTTRDIERANDTLVDPRRDWPRERVLAEYRRWSRAVLRFAAVVTRTPLRALPTRVGELGTFRMGVAVPGALVFDHHTHLHHDIAPVVGKPAPEIDADTMAVVVQWMLAVLGNQLKAAPPRWLTGPVVLELHGAGGGRWRIHPDGAVARDAGGEPVGTVRGPVAGFPAWGTTRTPWRQAGLELTGDSGQLERLLDAINIV